jgi:hypothetical protein
LAARLYPGLLYLLTLLATAAFVIFPLTGRSNPLYERENELKWVSDLIRTVANFLPDWASSWFIAYASYPKTFLALAVVLIALLAASSKAAASIADQMTALWKASLAHTMAAPVVALTNTLTVKERVLLALRSGWKDYLGPALSAIAIVYLGITLLNRSTFTALDEAGFVCTQSAESKNLKDIPLEGVLFSFDISNPCFATGYKVGRLDRYLVWTMPERAELDEENKTYKAAHKLTNDRREVGTCSTPANGTLVSAGVTADGRGYSTFRNDNGPTLGIRATLWNALRGTKGARRALLLRQRCGYRASRHPAILLGQQRLCDLFRPASIEVEQPPMTNALVCFVISAVCLTGAVRCFVANQVYRGAIDAALAAAQGGSIDVPERVKPYYDAAYLNKFISIADVQRTTLGKSALELYIRPTLLWIDIGFAVFYAAFLAFFWFGVSTLLAGHPVLEPVSKFFLTMSVVYGIADVAEDFWLVRLFLRGAKITKPEGALACLLTQTKLLAISLTLVGGLLFLALGKIFAKSRGG